VRAKVYVEGGGDKLELHTACRKGFSTLFERAGLRGHMPRIVASGSRGQAFSDFCTALRNAASDEFVCLLVDSEDPVRPNTSPWAFLGVRQADQWQRPPGADDDNAYLMVQCMEAWFLADGEALEGYFAQGFRRNALPNRTDVENIPKPDIFTALKRATCDCVPKGEYQKGVHSFEVLATLDPDKVAQASPYARRLFDTLKQKTQGT
jgi:hypothetical protein